MKLSLPQSRKSTCPIIKVLSRKGAATFSSWKCCKILFTDNPNLCSYMSFFSQCIFICIVEVYNYKHCTNPNFKFNSCYLFSVSFFLFFTPARFLLPSLQNVSNRWTSTINCIFFQQKIFSE